MEYEAVRGLMAVMHRGDTITIPNTDNTVKVNFNHAGQFVISITTANGGSVNNFTSLKEAATYVHNHAFN